MHSQFIEQVRCFYESHRQELFTYALALIKQRERAEDIVHTAFHNVLRRGRAPRELRPYIFRCIRNAAMDELRRPQPPVSPEPFLADTNGRGDPALQAAIEESLTGLSPDQRECIVLKLYDGLTFREIAAIRRVSTNTAASWYRRGIDKMRSLLRERMNDEGH